MVCFVGIMCIVPEDMPLRVNHMQMGEDDLHALLFNHIIQRICLPMHVVSPYRLQQFSRKFIILSAQLGKWRHIAYILDDVLI